MPAMIWDSATSAFKEADTPKVWDATSQAFKDSQGKVWDSTNQTWKDAWNNKATLYFIDIQVSAYTFQLNGVTIPKTTSETIANPWYGWYPSSQTLVMYTYPLKKGDVITVIAGRYAGGKADIFVGSPGGIVKSITDSVSITITGIKNKTPLHIFTVDNLGNNFKGCICIYEASSDSGISYTLN